MEQGQASHYGFGRIAEHYDDWYKSARGSLYDRLEKRAVDKLLARRRYNGQLLEVGCGTGHWSEYFSGKGFEVTGVDISADMINAAQRKNIVNSQFKIADGENLPFAEQSYDIAAAITTLEFASNPAKMLSEMARCVKKNGGIIIVGVLNALSRYNQKKKNKPGSVYSSANLFSPQQIHNLLAPFGKPNILIAGFVPDRSWLLWLSALYEFAGHFISGRRGAFIAARVDL
ncbi:MAG: methyltransferase domain-containing protein [Sedimentisphaerales bacterium]|nr:methyltransferase domain-containing protein [Sedimentisphaerales bacterium]